MPESSMSVSFEEHPSDRMIYLCGNGNPLIVVSAIGRIDFFTNVLGGLMFNSLDICATFRSNFEKIINLRLSGGKVFSN